MTADAASTRPGRHWFRPRFSLRFLLLVVTAFAIGFPIWYRWPYEEIQNEYPYVGGKPDTTQPPYLVATTTWRRTWGGEPMRQGTFMLRQFKGAEVWLERVEHYENDQLEGESVFRFGENHVYRGNYRQGERHGEWVRQYGKVSVTEMWRDGMLHGLTRTTRADGTTDESLFDGGILLTRNGRPIKHRLFKKLAEHKLDPDSLLFRELHSHSGGVLVKTPLKDVVAYLNDFHWGAPLEIDPLARTPERQVAQEITGVDLATALVLIADDLGLECDYRYGCAWITTPEDAAEWVDRTGVEEIKFADGSPQALAWSQPTEAAQVSAPLGRAVHDLVDRLGIACDTSRVDPIDGNAPPFPVTVFLRKHPLQQVLGYMLDQTGCRCELDGQTLVILPPAAPAAE